MKHKRIGQRDGEGGTKGKRMRRGLRAGRSQKERSDRRYGRRKNVGKERERHTGKEGR